MYITIEQDISQDLSNTEKAMELIVPPTATGESIDPRVVLWYRL